MPKSTDYYQYTVYEDGRIANPDGTLRNHNINSKGYVQVSVKIGNLWTTRHLHKLLYICFVGPIPEGYEVDHINNIRNDNRLSNLQLLTKSENNRKSYASGNRDVSGTKNANAKLTKNEVGIIKSSIETGITLAKRFSVSTSQISRIKRGINHAF